MCVTFSVGDSLSFEDLIAAWCADMRCAGADSAQAAFGVDLAGDSPRLERMWLPAWVQHRDAFAADLNASRSTLEFVVRDWARSPVGSNPFDGLLEAPRAVRGMWEHHRAGGSVAVEVVVGELVAMLWNIDPGGTARVSTTALFRTGTAARIVDEIPPDDEPIACPMCGWTGTVGQTDLEYFGGVFHRECPECEKMLLAV